MREIGKLLLIFGGMLVVVGALLLLGGRLPFRLGRLPGDIVWEGKSGSFYFPVVTCIVLSLILTAVMWIVSAFKR